MLFCRLNRYITPAVDTLDVSEVASHLARTYAFKIASDSVHRMLYNHSTKGFVLCYTMYTDVVDRNLTTKIYYSSTMHYPNGVQYTVEPQDYVAVQVDAEQNVIQLKPLKNPETNHRMLTFKMCPSFSTNCDVERL